MSEPSDDPELRALFVDEIRKHAVALARLPSDAATRARTLHAMRGATAMMGLADLAAQLADLEVETRGGDLDAGVRALPQIAAKLRSAGFQVDDLSFAPRVSSTPPAATERTSGAPSNLPERGSLDPEILAFFFSEAHARLEKLNDSLLAVARPSPADALDEAFRTVHAIKGAASTVGLPSIARGAHALEAALLTLKSYGRDLTAAEIDVLNTARAHLGVALTSPQSAGPQAESMVTVLREAKLVRDHDLQPVSRLPRDRERSGESLVDVIRVPARAVAALAESVGEVGSVGDRVATRSSSLRELSRWASHASRSIQDALQRIGPPKPWGAPADALDRLASVERSLVDVSSELDREGDALDHDAELLGTLVGGAQESLQRLGASSARWLFERVAPAAETLARGEGKELLVLRHGEDVEIPRGVAERLVEPFLQLVRNAVTHGVEAPELRLAHGKPARATVRLTASVESRRLRLVVADDGAGVDVDAVRRLAVEAGLLGEREARERRAVLAMLFMPGVSTRSSADATAGRGVGLDLVRREVTLLGGEVTVTSRRGAFTRFVVEITTRPITQRMLVVIVAGERLAVPLDRVVRVVATPHDTDGATVISLAQAVGISLLPAAAPSQGGAIVLLRCADGAHIGGGVDGVERAREFVVRPLPPLVAGLIPWAGCTLDGEGRVIMVLDVDALQPAKSISP